MFPAGAELLLYIHSKSVNHDDITPKVAGLKNRVSDVTFIIHTLDKVFLKITKTKQKTARGGELDPRKKQILVSRQINETLFV